MGEVELVEVSEGRRRAVVRAGNVELTFTRNAQGRCVVIARSKPDAQTWTPGDLDVPRGLFLQARQLAEKVLDTATRKRPRQLKLF
ncbi:hypothetical protein D6779_07995 [Candidatus Parcubacteria bacterium]|nr:MAG: hypothetical protein D6779_07995 [Candidatus Parcubacteria bacterium]